MQIFSLLTELTRMSSTSGSRRGKDRQTPFLTPCFWRKSWNHLPLSTMVVVFCRYLLLGWESYPLVLFVNVFLRNLLEFIKYFSCIYRDSRVICVFTSVLLYVLTKLTRFTILNQPWVYVLYHSWWWCLVWFAFFSYIFLYHIHSRCRSVLLFSWDFCTWIWVCSNTALTEWVQTCFTYVHLCVRTYEKCIKNLN